jgi:signal transduction histidine kinase
MSKTARRVRPTRPSLTVDLRRLTRLHELGSSLSIDERVEVSMQKVVAASLQITGADMGQVHLLTPAGEATIVASMGFEASGAALAQVRWDPLGADDGTGAANRPLVVEDIRSGNELAGTAAFDVLRSAGVTAFQATPLVGRSGGRLGALSTHYGAPHRFDDAELQWLDLIARQAADVVELQETHRTIAEISREMEHRVDDRTRWLTLLQDVSRAIDDAPTWDVALQRVVQRVCEAEGWQVGHVFLPGSDSPEVIRPAISWIENPRFRPFSELVQNQQYAWEQSLPGRVYLENELRWVDDHAQLRSLMPLRADAVSQLGLRSAAVIPIAVGGVRTAVLELLSDRPHPPSEQLENLMRVVGAQIGGVLDRERAALRMAELAWREQQELLHTLHDSIGQTLTGLGMLSASLGNRLAGTDEASETAREIARQSRVALQQVRQIAKGFFPIDVEAAGLVAALEELASTTEALHKIPVRTTLGPTKVGDGRVATQLYRIAQEATNNAVRHARAGMIRLDMRREYEVITLRITDDGIGMEVAGVREGLGLQIMRYRAASVGGRLTIDSKSGEGTSVTCVVRDWSARSDGLSAGRLKGLTR